MRTTRLMVAVCAIGATLALAACGDDDEPGTTTSGQATATVEASPEATKGGQGDATPEPEATKTPEAEQTPKPEKTVEGLPSSTPEPGPPLKFGAVVTADSIEVNTKTVESGPSLEVQLANESDAMVPINLIANGVTVAAGQIEAGEETVAQVRNLDPGKLVFKSGKLTKTVKVVDAE